jgi:hypothetical protein
LRVNPVPNIASTTRSLVFTSDKTSGKLPLSGIEIIGTSSFLIIARYTAASPFTAFISPI